MDELKESLHHFIMISIALICYVESFIICCPSLTEEEQTRIVKREYDGASSTNSKIIKSSLIAAGLIVIALLMLTQYH
jgi:hypothetical protein